MLQPTRIITITMLAAALWSAPAAADPGAQLDAMQAMLTRTSVRKFDQSRAVTDGELRQIMEAGFRTQTLDGSSPLEFVQIRSRKTLAAIAGSAKFADWMAQAPAAIAILVNTKASPRLFKENGSMAMLNMTYKAQELGLGTCFLGTRNYSKTKQILNVGKHRHLLTVIPVGKPVGEVKSPKRNPLEWTVSQGTYGGALKLAKGVEPSTRTGKPMSAFLNGRHSVVESFSRKPLEAGKLATALEAMRRAPSSKNKQHWRWVLVSDPAAKKRVARAARDNALADAPVVAVLAGSQDSRPFVNPKGWGRKRTSPTFINHGAVMALRNLQIGLESQGVGVRTKALGRRGDSRMRTLLSPTRPLSSKRVRFIAAVGMGYAKRSSTRQAMKMPTGRVFKERYGAK
jgi:nitroreductase